MNLNLQRDQVEPVYTLHVDRYSTPMRFLDRQDRTDEGFLGCMHNKFDLRKGKFLVVLDGCSPYFVNEEE